MKFHSVITYTHLHFPSLPHFLEQRTFCPESYVCLSLEPWNTLALNGKGDIPKIADVCVGGSGCHGNCFACQARCPATRESGSIQGDILWPLPTGTLPQAPRWASPEDFYYRGCQSSPSDHATVTRDIWQPGLGA